MTRGAQGLNRGHARVASHIELAWLSRLMAQTTRGRWQPIHVTPNSPHAPQAESSAGDAPGGEGAHAAEQLGADEEAWTLVLGRSGRRLVVQPTVGAWSRRRDDRLQADHDDLMYIAEAHKQMPRILMLLDALSRWRREDVRELVDRAEMITRLQHQVADLESYLLSRFRDDAREGEA